jgi:hypothetical protein
LTAIAQGVDVDKGELTRAALEEIERKAVQDFPRFVNLDLANIISSFLKLSYIPREILAEIN